LGRESTKTKFLGTFELSSPIQAFFLFVPRENSCSFFSNSSLGTLLVPGEGMYGKPARPKEKLGTDVFP